MSQPTVVDVAGIYQRLGQGLVDAATPGWATIELRSTMVDTAVEHHHWATDPDGARLACTPLSRDTLAAIEDLRGALYQGDKGAWITMSATITATGQIDIDVNYDDQPGWETPIPAAAYARDLARYPRDPEHVPAWMHQIITGQGPTPAPTTTFDVPGF